MKKSLLALAALTAFAGAASAQSSVTMYGRVDLSMGKNSGTDDAKYLANGSGSRLGLRGTEDLGGGLSALFNIEHRFDADTGAQTNAARFWTGRSIVGLRGGFGQVVLGREYVTSFLGSQLIADPWGWDTVAASTAGARLPLGLLVPGNTTVLAYGGTVGITGGGGIAKVRNDSSITYNIAAGGFSFGAQIAEATDAIAAPGRTNRPVNFNVGYAAGPLVLAFGLERTGFEGISPSAAALGATSSVTEDWMTINGSYNFGSFKVGAFYGRGDSFATGATHKSYMLTATAPIGAGEFRAAFGQLKADDQKMNRLFAAGYHYSMSKRTTLYFDMVNNSNTVVDDVGADTGSKMGYDIGIKHNF
jgi:predicted porin